MSLLHADKFAYFFIAFALYLLLRGISVLGAAPLANVLLYIAIALSLLASNIPRVLDIPLHYAYPVKCVEYFTFFIALICFAVLAIRHLV